MIKVLLLVAQAFLAQASKTYLYGGSSFPVKEFTGIKNDFRVSTGPRVVEFYSPYCPFCVDFKHDYIDLAISTRKLFPTVTFYAISCDDHSSVCEEMGIDGVPSLYVFPAGSHQGVHVEGDDASDYTPELLAKNLHLSTNLRTATGRRMDDGPAFGERADDFVDEPTDDANNPFDPEEAAQDDDAREGLIRDDNVPADDAVDEIDVDIEDVNEQVIAADAMTDDSNDKNAGDVEAEVDFNDKNAGDVETDDFIDKADGLDANFPDFGHGMADVQDSEDLDLDDDANERISQFDRSPEGGNLDDDDSRDYSPNADIDDMSRVSELRPGALSHNYKPELQFDPRPRGDAPLNLPPNLAKKFSGAGYHRASAKEKSMDRFKKDFMAQRDVYERKRNGLGGLIRHDGRLDKHGKPKVRHQADHLTPGMKAHKPGTEEFNKREKILLQRVEKGNKKLKKPPTSSSVARIDKESLPYVKDARQQTIVKKVTQNIPIVRRFTKMTPEEELILDVSLSFVTGLRSGVYFSTDPRLNAAQKASLKKFLDLLTVSLPPEWGIHKLIDQLHKRFKFITASPENLREVLKGHKLPSHQWSKSCTAGTMTKNGFACGFWKLLHVVTVGVAEQRGGLNLIESGMVKSTSMTFSPMDAADIIRDYIHHFYSCRMCSEHFVATYDDCDNNRRCDRLSPETDGATTADWKELPLWLWEFHNEVSVRTLHENEKKKQNTMFGGRRSEHTSDITVLWPSLEGCFLCFHEDGSFAEAEVFHHLEMSYWPDADLDPNSERLIHYEGDGSFSSALLLWVVTFMVLAGIYRMVGRTSPAALQRNMLRARQMVAMGTSGKKDRTT